ncbi:RES family NAD+ phosphorylase [Flavihumibacter sp. R14]|nr:RES family NAD+ phosphorylase [Flavihumibacter soli]
MIVYRLSKSYFSEDLTGKGAEMYGGRWNSKGRALLYTSESRALSITEIAVHIPLGIVPVDYCMSSIIIPDEVLIKEIRLSELALDWRTYPYSESTQLLGDEFIRQGEALVLKVPSAVVPGEYNYLINPAHSGFQKISILKIEPFVFDQRLFK